MTRHQLALFIGGMLPAVLLGLASIFQKLSTTAGIGLGPLLIVIGLTSTAVGAVFCADGDWTWTRGGTGYAVLFGVCWATATGCVGLALKKYGAQISQLVPLYNMNTLIAVVIGLIAFAEWRTVQPLRISLAAVLIVSGGIRLRNREPKRAKGGKITLLILTPDEGLPPATTDPQARKQALQTQNRLNLL